jgi:hypothetical protein
MFRHIKNTAIALAAVTALAGLVESAKAYDATLNGRVLAYAQSKMGQKVGDGQCWALVDQALAAAGAHRPGQDGYGTYVFGEVYTPYGTPTHPSIYHKHPHYFLIQAGDVIQFEGVKFVYPNAYQDFPHHSAIVVSRNGTQITIINQNAPVGSGVSTQTIDLTMRTQGTLTFFHPAAK